MKRYQMALLAGWMFLLAGTIESVAGLWKQYHATTAHEAMAFVMGPVFLAVGFLWLAVGRMFRKKDERI